MDPITITTKYRGVEIAIVCCESVSMLFPGGTSLPQKFPFDGTPGEALDFALDQIEDVYLDQLQEVAQ